MLFVPLLAINISVPDGATIMAEGTLPVGTLLPLAVKMPVVRSMLKDETEESPSASNEKRPRT